MGERMIEFTGRECVHCRELKPLLEKLESEEKVKITTLEVWHDQKNAELMRKLDIDSSGKVFCGGVPFLYNEKTGAKVCGVVGYDKLREWALGNGAKAGKA